MTPGVVEEDCGSGSKDSIAGKRVNSTTRILRMPKHEKNENSRIAGI